jgi:hypothetical protein
MSEITKDIEASLKTFQPTKPVFRVSTGYYGDIELKRILTPQSTSDDFVTKHVITNRVEIRQVFNKETRTHHIKMDSHDLYSNVIWEMIRFFTSFITKHSEHKNPKLTSLYRWYNGALNSGSFQNHPDLESNLWNIYKWLKTEPTITSTVADNALKLLELMRQKYEAKGITL